MKALFKMQLMNEINVLSCLSGQILLFLLPPHVWNHVEQPRVQNWHDRRTNKGKIHGWITWRQRRTFGILVYQIRDVFSRLN